MRAGQILTAAIRVYQRAVSPYIGPCCRFHPSCSEFMIGSIRLNGPVVGLFDGIRRILRCHPFHPGGVDEPRRVQLLATRSRWKRG
ncbi:MAG: membrane protein insertion efficiency factor YidD [Gemmatimonadota bacterium]